MFYFFPVCRPNSQKKNDPAQTAKKKHDPDPSERVSFLLFGRGGGVSFFWLFGRGACFSLRFGRVRLCFCCLGGGRVFCFLFGRGACFLFAVWAGDGSSLTYRSAWLVFKGLNNKKDQTAEKKHEFRVPTRGSFQKPSTYINPKP